jgi:hypothetical protein
MFRKLMMFAALLLVAFAGCSGDSSGPPVPLNVDFSTTATHAHLWETQPRYTALITSESDTVSAFDSLYLQFAPSGTDQWTSFGPLFTQGAGGAWSATVTYPQQSVPGPDARTGAEGTLSIRLMGHRTHQIGRATVIYAPSSTLAPVNQHTEGGPLPGTTWRVEFAPLPGQNDIGDRPVATFYVMQNTADSTGYKAPIPGLTGLVVSCIDPNGGSADVAATETASGTYSATCWVPMEGWWHATVTFTNVTGSPTFTGNFGVGPWWTAWGPPE